MEIQATVAPGLVHCTEGLREKGDEVVVLVCMKCLRLETIRSCVANTGLDEVTLLYDTVVLDCVNRIKYSCLFKYTLDPDI